MRRRGSHAVFAVPVVQKHQDVAMNAVRRQQDQDNEIGDQQGQVKGVHLIQTLEGGIEKMRAKVMAQAVGRHQRQQKRHRAQGLAPF